jgi:hypothetical protein
MLELTRHGKTVATVGPSKALPSKTLASWVGSGRGSVTVLRDEALTGPAFAHFEDTHDVWSPLTAEQHAERQGTKATKSWDQLLGQGRAEDWDGFEDALERWREEPCRW